MPGEFDESKHPRDHGKFSTSEGAGGDSKPNPHERAAESLKNREFVQRHAERFSRAGDEARSNFPGREATDEAHAAAAAHIHGEAMRIHAEEDAHGGDAHLKEAADEARSISRSGGGYLEDQHAAAMDAIAAHRAEAAEQRANRESEDKAIAAGHLSPAARDIADQYMAGHQQREQTIGEHAAALDQAHREAANALAALHEYSSEGHDDFGFDHHLHEGFNETQRSLHEATGRDEHEQYANSNEVSARETPAHPDEIEHEVPHPDEGEHAPDSPEYAQQLAAHEAWHSQAEAEYNAAHAAHGAEYKQRAETAQSALERLHEQQTAAHAALKEAHESGDRAHSAATRALDKINPEKQVNESAFANHARDESGDFADEHVAEQYSDAHQAAETMLDHASSQVSEHGPRDLSDTLDNLKQSTRDTASVLKALAKITGRAPNLPGKPGKAKKGAYCPECGRRLVG